jgi:hypothetical protein
MAKTDRILACFPSFFRTRDTTKLFHEVVTRLAQPLEEADTHLFRIQRAHRLLVAEDAEDIVRLAGALNLTAFHFEDLENDTSLTYAARLSLMRDRVARVARLHLLGLGTPWAVMEAASIFLSARIVPEREREPLIAHLDDRHLSHKAVIEFGTPDARRERIYLHEGLFRRRKVEPSERWQLNSWMAQNTNPEPAPARFVLQGVSDHTVRPSIFCPATGEGLWFNGVVPEGRTLIIDRESGALLDDQPVDDWLVAFKGGLNDFSRSDGAVFVTERGGAARTAFFGALDDITVSAIRTPVAPPAVPTGRAEWFFKVAEGLYDGSDFDLAVFDPPAEPIGIFEGDLSYDGCVFDYPGGGLVGMGWDESIPCAFKLLLPPRPDEGGGTPQAGPNDVSRISAILPRFRAAGIRAIVDTAKDAWILGESVIRDSGATGGSGLTRRSTRLHDESADRFVPLDSTTEAGSPA